MNIGNNIARFRKMKNMTQDDLGKILRVSNQAVSKWESGVSMPDIMLLPEIAKALGVTLDAIYDIKPDTPLKNAVSADDFPNVAFDTLHHLFFDSTKMRFSYEGASDDEQLQIQKQALNEGQYIGCISNTAGAVIITDNFDHCKKYGCKLYNFRENGMFL